MTARFLRNLLFAQLALMLLVGYFSLHSSGSWLQAFGAAVLVLLGLRILITLQNFCLAWYYQSDTPNAQRLSSWQVVALFLGEFYATLMSSSWYMWRKTFTQRQTPTASTSLPILLIHGYGCNSGYWNALSPVLLAQGMHHFAIDLEPILADIDSYVPMLAEKIDAICTATGQSQIIIVAHSMGGLVTRCYMRAHGTSKIAHIITLGTPHNGTGLANFGIGKNSQQMAYRKRVGASTWLQELAATENPATRALITSIYTRHDNIVSPQNSSELAGAKNLALHGMGHVAMAFSPQVQQAVLDEIASINQAWQVST